MSRSDLWTEGLREDPADSSKLKLAVHMARDFRERLVETYFHELQFICAELNTGRLDWTTFWSWYDVLVALIGELRAGGQQPGYDRLDEEDCKLIGRVRSAIELANSPPAFETP